MAFPLVSEGVRSSLFFGVFGKVLDLFGRPHNVASYSEIAVAAAVGGCVQGIAATPVELVKIQLQSPNGQHTAYIADCIQQSVVWPLSLRGGYNYDSTSIRRPFDGRSTAYQ